MRHLFLFEKFNLSISKSKVDLDGKGLFINSNISANTKICLIADISKIDGSDNWVNKYGHSINHSTNPNSKAEMSGYKCYLISLRDIKAGEELLTDYRKIPSFFDKKIR